MTQILASIGSFITPSHVMVIIYIMNTVIAFGLIFLDTNKSPSAIMAWIMIMYIMPVFGLFLYLILSQNIARLQIFLQIRHTVAKLCGRGRTGRDGLYACPSEIIRQRGDRRLQ